MFYSIYKQRVLRYQFGGRYEEKTEGEGQWVDDFETVEAAIAKAKNLRDANLDEFEITRARQGLDSIEYSVWEVWQTDDEDDCTIIDAFSTVTDEREKAIERAEQSYWAFLDFEEDSYHGIED